MAHFIEVTQEAAAITDLSYQALSAHPVNARIDDAPAVVLVATLTLAELSLFSGSSVLI